MYSLHGLQQKESYRKEKDIWYKIKLSYSVLIEKISSLLSVDYCKSNKKNQFKDIKLQLHASTVTNPYTFSIQGNRSFSASCAAALPETETFLYNDSNDTDNLSITIPSGVKVLKVYGYVETDSDHSGNESGLIIKNLYNNKNWIALHVDGSTDGQEYTNYIGVTPGKSYFLSIVMYENNGWGGATISYSSSINNHSVVIEDY